MSVSPAGGLGGLGFLRDFMDIGKGLVQQSLLMHEAKSIPKLSGPLDASKLIQNFTNPTWRDRERASGRLRGRVLAGRVDGKQSPLAWIG